MIQNPLREGKGEEITYLLKYSTGGCAGASNA